MSTSQNKVYERKGRCYDPKEIFEHLPERLGRDQKTLKKIKHNFDGDLIKMGSDRYYVFQRTCKCEFCDRVGTVMYKERDNRKNPVPNDTRQYHFNLYAIDQDGHEILMTKDHVVPKSNGGEDTLDNYVTCCQECNSQKGSMDIDTFRNLKQQGFYEKQFRGKKHEQIQYWVGACGQKEEVQTAKEG